MDETELLVFTQALQPGYGAQLPLYAWLQYLSFSLFGINIVALSLLKYTLLFSTFVCVMEIALKVLKDEMGAAIATLSLFLIPQIAWESYRTLTNTVLATFMAALTLLLFVRTREKPIWTNYCLLGAAAGFGMLSKYNYTIFLIAVIIAGIATPGFRKTVIARKSILSLAVMLLITAPPYAWIMVNLDRATGSMKKLQALDGGSLFKDWAFGFGSLIAAWIGYFWPALIVYAVFFFRFKPVRKTTANKEIHQLLVRTLIAAFSICSLLILIFKVTYFKERWLQPLLFFLPIFFLYYLGARIDRKRFKGLIAATMVPALLAMLVFSGGVLLASKTGKAMRQSPPYRSMAAQILQNGFNGGTIITVDHRIGGNFRLFFKGSSVLVPGMMEVPTKSSDPTLVLWNAERSEAPPERLVTYVNKLLEVKLDTSEARYVEKPMLYWKGRTMRLGYFIIKGR